MKYLEMRIEIEPKYVEMLLNELAVKGITDVVIDNPEEIAELVDSLSDTEWYYGEQIEEIVNTNAGDYYLTQGTGSGLSPGTDVDSSVGQLAAVTIYCTDDEEGEKRAELVKFVATQVEHIIDVEAQLIDAEAQQTDEYVDAVSGTEHCRVTIYEELRDDSEWGNAWKEYYHTTRVSEKFIVKPSWEEWHEVGNAAGVTEAAEKGDYFDNDNRLGESGFYVIEIDPGMAFGTGTHETTSLSLRMLEKYVKPGDRILDVGTGSGILAIASSMLGAGDVLGIDIDKDAVRVANENIEFNIRGLNNKRINNLNTDDNVNTDANVDVYVTEKANKTENSNDEKKCIKSHIIAVEGNLTEGTDYKADIVVANLLADLIIKLSGSVREHMLKDGVFISSGILLEKREQVETCLCENGFKIIEVMTDGEWCAIAAK